MLIECIFRRLLIPIQEDKTKHVFGIFGMIASEMISYNFELRIGKKKLM